MPAGPSTSGGCDGSSVTYSDSKPVDHAGVVDPHAYFLTRPKVAIPASPLPATPDSDTYMLPAESNVMPRGELSPVITGVATPAALALTDPTATAAPTRPNTTIADRRTRSRVIAPLPRQAVTAPPARTEANALPRPGKCQLVPAGWPDERTLRRVTAIEIRDVTPRDGLQSERPIAPLERGRAGERSRRSGLARHRGRFVRVPAGRAVDGRGRRGLP